jgi:hypothetical protein
MYLSSFNKNQIFYNFDLSSIGPDITPTSVSFGYISSIDKCSIVITSSSSNPKNTIIRYTYDKTGNIMNGELDNIANSIKFENNIDTVGDIVSTIYLGTTSIFNELGQNFLVGGYTNNPLTSIVYNRTDVLDQYFPSITSRFNGIIEKQFINSHNRTIVATNIPKRYTHPGNVFLNIIDKSYVFDNAKIPITKDPLSIYNILVYTRPDTNMIPSYHNMKVLVKGSENKGIYVISDFTEDGEAVNPNFDSVRNAGDNLLIRPNIADDGIFAIIKNGYYVICYQSTYDYTYINGMGASVQQEV